MDDARVYPQQCAFVYTDEYLDNTCCRRLLPLKRFLIPGCLKRWRWIIAIIIIITIFVYLRISCTDPRARKSVQKIPKFATCEGGSCVSRVLNSIAGVFGVKSTNVVVGNPVYIIRPSNISIGYHEQFSRVSINPLTIVRNSQRQHSRWIRTRARHRRVRTIIITIMIACKTVLLIFHVIFSTSTIFACTRERLVRRFYTRPSTFFH